MMVVVGVVAILALMSGPALARLAPYQRLRGEVQGAATFLRQARLKAAGGQKPVRVTLDCSGVISAPPRPCRTLLETANYDQGQVVSWTEAAGTRHELSPRVRIARAPGALDGDGLATDRKDGVSWMVFMPSGRAYSDPRPFALDFSATDMAGPNRTAWRLTVNNDSGRVGLSPTTLP
jgi:type II secretory pathway pseudopilin PulG